MVGGAAHAVLTARVGSTTDQQRFVHETNAWATNAPAFVAVPGAATTVVVPAGTRRMVSARFSAESACTGTAGWCSVRIVLTRGTSMVEMNPQSGTDFAFDSAGPANQWESHAREQTSPFVSAGTYVVRVQAGTVAGATSLRLDEWTLAVERIRP